MSTNDRKEWIVEFETPYVTSWITIHEEAAMKALIESCPCSVCSPQLDHRLREAFHIRMKPQTLEKCLAICNFYSIMSNGDTRFRIRDVNRRYILPFDLCK